MGGHRLKLGYFGGVGGVGGVVVQWHITAVPGLHGRVGT
jgi:hypothetical protein